MIIYPIIILVLLLFAFAIVWRRAYILEKEGQIVEQVQLGDQKTKASFLVMEPEVAMRRELEPNFQKAEDLFRKKQYISAEKWYIEAAKRDPKNPVIYARLGVIYLEQKNYKDAIEALSEAIKLDPGSASRYFNLSFALNAEGDKKEAILNAKKALRLDPHNLKYRKWLEELRAKPF